MWSAVGVNVGKVSIHEPCRVKWTGMQTGSFGSGSESFLTAADSLDCVSDGFSTSLLFPIGSFDMTFKTRSASDSNNETPGVVFCVDAIRFSAAAANNSRRFCIGSRTNNPRQLFSYGIID